MENINGAENKELVVKEDTNQSVTVNDPNLVSQFLSDGQRNMNLWTSLPLDDKIGIALAMGDADYNLKEFFMNGGKSINLVNALTHFVNIVSDETGETEEAVRVVLIDDQGVTYSTVANGARTSLMNLFSIFGLPPYNPPLEIAVRQVKTRKGFYTLNIIPVRK